MKTVRILGTAPNLSEMPPIPGGVEVWMANDPKTYRKYIADLPNHYTRWFNLHSRAHMQKTYPRGLKWYMEQDGSRPFYTQKFWADIPGCQAFPHTQIQSFFNTRYFTCSIAWLLAFAIMEGFDKIELWGFQLSDRKPGHTHKWERPCFFYWVKQARDRGIEVTYQQAIQEMPHIAGDPLAHDGSLYGYDTKPEKDN